MQTCSLCDGIDSFIFYCDSSGKCRGGIKRRHWIKFQHMKTWGFVSDYNFINAINLMHNHSGGAYRRDTTQTHPASLLASFGRPNMHKVPFPMRIRCSLDAYDDSRSSNLLWRMADQTFSLDFHLCECVHSTEL